MRAIFDDPRRRRAILYWWLHALPTSLLQRGRLTGDQVMEHYIRSIAIEPSCVRVTTTTVQFNAHIVLPRALFSEDEADAIASSSSLSFTEHNRACWLRDFLAIVYARNWTLPALVALQRLIFVQRNWLPMLLHAEHMLQGQGGRPDRHPQ
jgi:hypothetical protein